jgi:hypothetical protein
MGVLVMVCNNNPVPFKDVMNNKVLVREAPVILPIKKGPFTSDNYTHSPLLLVSTQFVSSVNRCKDLNASLPYTLFITICFKYNDNFDI